MVHLQFSDKEVRDDVVMMWCECWIMNEMGSGDVERRVMVRKSRKQGRIADFTRGAKCWNQ